MIRKSFRENYLRCAFILLASVSFFGGINASPLFAETKEKEIEGLVRILDIIPTVDLDLRYATTNNFTNKKIYPVSVCLLRKETAQKLARAQTQFQKEGFSIKIWDAYRPPYVQRIFWELVSDERYVANPNKGGSRHNRGGAVDLTLVDKFGKELEMPSAFDDFSDRASPSNLDMSPEARKNVDYLNRVMTENGFLMYSHEWWHFDDSDWRDFPFVDVRLEKFLTEDELWLTKLQELRQSSRQVVLVREVSPGESQAILTGFELNNGVWKIVFGPIDAVIGKNGMSAAGEKKEGDGKTPSGTFSLSGAFGDGPPIATKLSFRPTTENDFWVDDPASAQYNQWVVGRPKAQSFEQLKRDDGLYKYAVIIDYNTHPVAAGAGSAIFLHIWRDNTSPTAGCVAISQENIVKLLQWLNQSSQPLIVLEPKILSP